MGAFRLVTKEDAKRAGAAQAQAPSVTISPTGKLSINARAMLECGFEGKDRVLVYHDAEGRRLAFCHKITPDKRSDAVALWGKGDTAGRCASLSRVLRAIGAPRVERTMRYVPYLDTVTGFMVINLDEGTPARRAKA